MPSLTRSRPGGLPPQESNGNCQVYFFLFGQVLGRRVRDLTGKRDRQVTPFGLRPGGTRFGVGWQLVCQHSKGQTGIIAIQ